MKPFEPRTAHDVSPLIKRVLPPLPVVPLPAVAPPPGARLPALADREIWREVDALGLPDLTPVLVGLVDSAILSVLAALPLEDRERERVNPELRIAAEEVALLRAEDWRRAMRHEQFRQLRALFPRPEVDDA